MNQEKDNTIATSLSLILVHKLQRRHLCNLQEENFNFFHWIAANFTLELVNVES